jgi:hypothetical protein
MHVVVARQAIFDRQRKVYGYELLFRSEAESNAFDGTEAAAAGDHATGKRRQHGDDDGGTGTVYPGLAHLFWLLRNARGVDRLDPLGPVAAQGGSVAAVENTAADTFQKALINLQNAEGFLRRGGNRKRSETNAREAAQTAEDAHLITIKKLQEEQLARERAAAAEREAAVRAEADAQAQRRAQGETERISAERAKREAEDVTRRAERQQAEAEAASAAAVAQQQSARLEADRARLAAEETNRGRQQAEAEKIELRDRLLPPYLIGGRYYIRKKGVIEIGAASSNCHTRVMPDGSLRR